jgi:hypothetical protein
MSDGMNPTDDLGGMLALDAKGPNDFEASLENFWGGAVWEDAIARMALAVLTASGKDQLASMHVRLLAKPAPETPQPIAARPLTDEADQWIARLGDPLCLHGSVDLREGEGASLQDVPMGANLPAPDELPSTAETAAAEGWTNFAKGPIEFRRIGPMWPTAENDGLLPHQSWMKLRMGLPDDQRIHTAALVYLSAFYSHWSFERRAGPGFDNGAYKTLDHTVWLHGATRWDDWVLLRDANFVADNGVGVAQRHLFSRDGKLLATAMHSGRIAMQA